MPRRMRNQTGWLVRTDSGYYQAHWMEYEADSTTGRSIGVHRSKILGEVSKMRQAQADKELAKIVAPLNDRLQDGAGGRVTLTWFIDNRFLPIKRKDWGPATRQGNEGDIERYIKPYLGNARLEDIDLAMLSAWLERLAGAKPQGLSLSESVVRRAKTMASSILELAADPDNQPLITRNPARSRYYRMPICKATRRPVISKEQIFALWSAITDVRDNLIVVTGTCCAVTGSELFGLVWDCVHADRLEIRGTAWAGELYEYRVKRRARFRVIPINDEIRRKFEKWRQIAQTLGHDVQSPGALVFPGEGGGTMWSGVFLQDHVQAIAKKIGISVPVTFQVLRRSFATWNQHSLKQAQTVMGHDDIATTGNVYAQDVDPEARALVDGYYRDIVRLGKQAARAQLKQAPARVQ